MRYTGVDVVDAGGSSEASLRRGDSLGILFYDFESVVNIYVLGLLFYN